LSGAEALGVSPNFFKYPRDICSDKELVLYIVIVVLDIGP